MNAIDVVDATKQLSELVCRGWSVKVSRNVAGNQVLVKAKRIDSPPNGKVYRLAKTVKQAESFYTAYFYLINRLYESVFYPNAESRNHRVHTKKPQEADFPFAKLCAKPNAQSIKAGLRDVQFYPLATSVDESVKMKLRGKSELMEKIKKGVKFISMYGVGPTKVANDLTKHPVRVTHLTSADTSADNPCAELSRELRVEELSNRLEQAGIKAHVLYDKESGKVFIDTESQTYSTTYSTPWRATNLGRVRELLKILDVRYTWHTREDFDKLDFHMIHLGE